ncbi:hypothetical protein EOD42_06890 [Rhodovarius crocodyli]|uniref:Uncharacterized protein n=1 Tax=Rhodovarius crocodyli TaxID=1979269 RepID=A0A437MIX2_9PROT|nr:hypothetical protein EOD42_06890 [Rhodovarius crocodyli]
MLPATFLFPGAGLPWRPVGDAAQHAVAQRFFIASDWGWPPLDIGLMGGLNLAFADGIPLLALPLKAVREWLPPGFHGIGLWYAIAWATLPPAAAWAFAGTGERRPLPLLCMAVAAVSMPAFIMRFGHAALCGHTVLWLGLGLYLRLVDEARPRKRGLWAGAVLLQAATLLIHPYLAVMTLALLAAVPATLLLRGRNFIGAALGMAAALAGVVGVMAAFGYLGAVGDGQRWYGAFALNLLSPIWPFRSFFLGGLVGTEIDATGHGGWEGYNWLGTGLILALFLVVLGHGRTALRGLRSHAGLVAVCLGLTLLAVSMRVGLGHAVLLDLGTPPAALEQFRASGRFFWPVGAAILLGVAAVLSRAGRTGTIALAALAVLQFIDAAPQRAAFSAWAAQRPDWRIDADRLRPAIAAATRVTLVPSWVCTSPDDHETREAILELLALISENPRPVNTMYAARWRVPPVCEPVAGAPAPGELRLTWRNGRWE